jgi:very-short-patch-repair endonuclease
MEGWRAVGLRAARQHGVVSHPQLLALGISRQAVKNAVASGRLYPLFHGTYAVGHAGVTRHGRLLAATLACGPGAVVSHGTAAELLGFRDFVPDEVDVIAPVEAGRKIPGICRRHVPSPASREVRVHAGVPCTGPSRTIVDLAGILREPALRRAIEAAKVEGMLIVPEIDAILAGPSRRGAPLLRAILDDWRRYPAEIRVRSRLEAKLLPLLTRRGLPIPRVNTRLRIGAKRYELDFLWSEHRLVVETDGGRYHGHPVAQARDSARNRALRAAGYEVRRLAWEDLVDRPESTLAEIARLLA